MKSLQEKIDKLFKLLAIILLIIVLALAYYYFTHHWGKGGFVERYPGATPPPGIEFLYSIYGPGPKSPVPYFWRPLAVRVDKNKNLYVSDTNNRRICVFDWQGRFIFEFGSFGVANPPGEIESTWRGGQFAFPYGIDVSEDGRIYVADMLNGRVQYFDNDGDFIDFFPKEKAFDPELLGHKFMLHPQNLTVKGDKVYVCDSFRVAIFSLEGKHIRSIGSKKIGFAEGWLDHPNGVAVGNDGTIYVADTNNFRIQAFTPDNKLKWVYGGPTKNERIGIPRGMAIDKKGNLLVIDALNSNILVFSPKGELLARLGSRGGGSGYFNFPNDIAVRPDGIIFVADKESNRIQAIRITY